MKQYRTYIYIAMSSVALFIVLVIQVNWIFQTAKIKEELFNEKANQVVTKTAEVLSKDTFIYNRMQTCMGDGDIHKIDSLFEMYMKFYNFKIEYAFEIRQPNGFKKKEDSLFANSTYKKRLDSFANKRGVELNLIVPKKKQFILAEMSPVFITSVLLIIAVLMLFWRTILSLLKEKKIADYTSDFLNNMTHEFKTPLTNIALATKMMANKANQKQADKVQHYASIILEENEKLRLQVEQVLSMTALERGEIPLRKTELDVHQLIHDTIKCMHLQIEDKEGELTLDLKAHHFVIMGDKTHLTNALYNLIDNAIKYAKDKPILSLKTTNIGKHLQLIISDKGIGIEKAYHKKIFDKFFRVPTGNVHDVKGFGLGLTYIKKIIDLHGGTIEVQSEKGKGTTFTITFHYV